MGGYLPDLFIGVAGSIVSAGILYFFSRLFSNSSKSGQTQPGLGDVTILNVPPKPGPLFRKPRTRPLLISLLLAVVLLTMDLMYPPAPFRIVWSDSRVVLDEAEFSLDDSNNRAEDILEIARQDAADVLYEAADDARRLREEGQEDMATRVAQFGEQEARRLMEAAHRRADIVTQVAKTRAERLYSKGDELLAEDPQQSSLSLAPFVLWPLRSFLFLGLISIAGQFWHNIEVKRRSMYAILAMSLFIGVIEQLNLSLLFHLALPFLVGGIVYAGSNLKGSGRETLFAGLYLTYRRFSSILTIVAIQLLAILILVALSIPISHLIARTMAERSQTVSYVGEENLILMIGAATAAFVGWEVSRAVATLMFFSVLSNVSSSSARPESN